MTAETKEVNPILLKLINPILIALLKRTFLDSWIAYDENGNVKPMNLVIEEFARRCMKNVPEAEILQALHLAVAGKRIDRRPRSVRTGGGQWIRHV